jgi:hypothetical protein
MSLDLKSNHFDLSAAERYRLPRLGSGNLQELQRQVLELQGIRGGEVASNERFGRDNGSTVATNTDPQTGALTGYTIDPDGAGAAAAFPIDNPDFNLRSLRGTGVLRWEY